MGKRLFIAEKPSVAKEFARVMGVSGSGRDGYMESDETVVTWCVGHLITMSYPESYDPALKKWSLETIPFLPDTFLYEVIPEVKKQFNTVSTLLNRDDVDTIYICTDSGREGEYIYRLVDQMAAVPDSKKKLRVWIDSQTEDEIKRGIRQARPMSEYDNLSDSAYLRAKEDYLMGINFSRVLSIQYGQWLNNKFKEKKWTSVSVGRVMTCVLGMVVKREWEIRRFEKTPFYRVMGNFVLGGVPLQGEWRIDEGSAWYESELIREITDDKGKKKTEYDFSLSASLYKENGFRKKEDAKKLIDSLGEGLIQGVIESVFKKTEKKNPPLLFNLAELQNLSSKLFKISPDETLQIVQDLYERKLVTYPRTDARVLSTAVAKEITKNFKGLQSYSMVLPYLREIADEKSYIGIEKTKYVDDKKITDHYAIIPTGAGIGGLSSLSELHQRMYEVIVRRFLSIFFPPAVYQKLSVKISCDSTKDNDGKQIDDKGVKSKDSTDVDNTRETFVISAKVLADEGFLPVNQFSFTKKKTEAQTREKSDTDTDDEAYESDDSADDLRTVIDKIKKGTKVELSGCMIKEGETSPPKRYNSGSMILAMENAGQLIEDEELRAQIKGSGIGTSATRAEILKKLFNIGYLKLNKKTQMITPAYKGELVYGIVRYSMPSMLSPKMTASWEKGLTQVADGDITKDLYMEKLAGFIRGMVEQAKTTDHMRELTGYSKSVGEYY